MSAASAEVLSYAVEEAISSEASVTVVLEDGRALTGMVTTYPSLPEGALMVVPLTPSKDRAVAFDRDDVVGVIFE
jgi:hypothetical protein